MADYATDDIYTGRLEFMGVDNPHVVGDVILWASSNCTDPEECRRINFQNDLGMRIYDPYTVAGYMRTGEDITEKDAMIVVKPECAYLLHGYYG